MKIKYVFLGIFTYLVTTTVFSQTLELNKKFKNEGVFNVTQIGYNRGSGTIHIADGINPKNKGYVVRLRTTFGYFINPNLSLGLGFGLDGIHNPTFNTAPLILDARYYLKENTNTVFLNVGLGYSLKLTNDFQKGLVNSYNIGYRFILGRKTHLLLSGGIDFHQIKDGELLIYSNGQLDLVKSSFWLKSLSFNAGFLF